MALEPGAVFPTSRRNPDVQKRCEVWWLGVQKRGQEPPLLPALQAVLRLCTGLTVRPLRRSVS